MGDENGSGQISCVIDATSLRPDRLTGIERFTQGALTSLPTALPDWRWKVIVRRDVDVKVPKGVELISIGGRSRIVRDQIYLAQQLRRLHPALVLYPGYPPPIFAPRDSKQVVVIHDATYWRFRNTLSRGAKLYYLPLLNLNIRVGAIDGVLTHSKASECDLTEILPTRLPVLGVPLGVNRLPTSLNALDMKPYALAVGTIEPRKNYETLLAAWKGLADGGISVPLKIVGRSGWGMAVSSATAVPEEVEFVGAVSDAELSSLYENCRLFVMPSLYEGFGFPIIEAMLHGRRCIVSDIPVFREVGGDRATYVPAMAIDAWVSAVADAWQAPEDALSAATTIAWASQFSWERWSKDVADMLRKVAAA